MTLAELYKKAQDFIGGAGQTYNNVVGNAGQTFNNANAVVRQMPQAVTQTVQNIPRATVQNFDTLKSKINAFGNSPAPQWAQNIPTIQNTLFKGMRNAPLADFSKDVPWTSPGTKIGAIFGEGIVNMPSQFLRSSGEMFNTASTMDQSDPTQWKKLGGEVLKTGLDASMFTPVGAAFKTAKIAIPEAKVAYKSLSELLPVMYKGAKDMSSLMGKYGAGYGLADSMIQDKNLPDTAKEMLTQYVVGRVAGFAVGGVAAGVVPAAKITTNEIRNVLRDIKAKVNPTEVSSIKANIPSIGWVTKDELQQMKNGSFTGTGGATEQQDINQFVNTIWNQAEKKVFTGPEPYKPKSATGQYLQNPKAGMAIEDVSGGKPGYAEAPVQTNTIHPLLQQSINEAKAKGMTTEQFIDSHIPSRGGSLFTLPREEMMAIQKEIGVDFSRPTKFNEDRIISYLTNLYNSVPKVQRGVPGAPVLTNLTQGAIVKPSVPLKAIQFVSPSVKEGQNLEQATANMKSKEYVVNRKAVESSYENDGIPGPIEPGRGVWSDGAEETFIKKITEDIPDDQRIYALAKNSKGLVQKDSIDFKLDPAGKDELFQIDPGAMTTEEVKSVLDASGIEFKTLGEKEVYVVNSGEYFDPSMEGVLSRLEKANGWGVKAEKGIATFLTGLDGSAPREAATPIYDRIINNFENSYGVEHNKGLQSNPVLGGSQAIEGSATSAANPAGATNAPGIAGTESTSRPVRVGNRTIFLNGAPADLTGSTASVNTSGRKLLNVSINKDTIPVNRIDGTPQLPSGEPFNAQKLLETPQVSRLPSAGGLATTPGQAKKLFVKTGESPRLNFKVKGSKKVIPLTEDSALLNPDTARQTVEANLPAQRDNFERGIYGNTTNDLVTGTKGATSFQKISRPLVNKFNTKVSQGLSSENPLVRNVSRGLRFLMGDAGSTAERKAAQGMLNGGISSAENLAGDFKMLGDTILPDKLSREKVWAHLDPELSGVKVGVEHLSENEQTAVNFLRAASNLINDQNFAMGRISHETWLAGRNGKYITRAYKLYDVPPELSDNVQVGSGKLDLTGYKKRGDVTEFKQEDAIKDPFYLAAKRVQSTFQNKAITDYANFLSKTEGMISDTARAGYTQLSDNPMWGALAGKHIRHDALVDMKGFYSDSKVLQGIFDGLNAYDRNAFRQVLKKTKTVYNPGTRLGNQVMNRTVFAALNGINLVKFNWLMQTFAKKELANNGMYARLFRKLGGFGKDSTKYDLVRNLVGEKDGVISKVKKLDNAVADSYGAADDRAKISAFKYWIDKGKSPEEAVRKVKNGFQDYSKVGQAYDIGSKLWVVGKPFIRFQSELVRIIKNSVLENPLQAPIVVGSIWALGEIASKASGESPEDKKTRENRYGVPVIPFTNIPLVIQTSYGEVNIARMFGMYETTGPDTVNATVGERASKYLPLNIPSMKSSADFIKSQNNDVMTSPIVSVMGNVDFRGKSVRDPNETKYKASTLTDMEQNINRAKFLGYGYNMPVLNNIIGISQAAQGKENQYQQTKTVPQAITSALGFKMEQFGPKQANDTRIKEKQFEQYNRSDIKVNINNILKDKAAGKIDESTAQSRIDNQMNKLKPVAKPVGSVSFPGTAVKASTIDTSAYDKKIEPNPMGGFSYTSETGDFVTSKTKELAQIALAKEDFANSDQNIMKFGGKVLRKSSDGTISVTSQEKYDTQLYSAQLSSRKRNDDLSGWFAAAEKKFEGLQKQLNDPSIDELEKVQIQDDIDLLSEQYTKFKDYGGFTKPKKGKKPAKISVKIKGIKATTFKAPKITSPKISFTGGKLALPKFTPVSAPSFKVKKINYKPSVSTVRGAKRLA